MSCCQPVKALSERADGADCPALSLHRSSLFGPHLFRQGVSAEVSFPRKSRARPGHASKRTPGTLSPVFHGSDHGTLQPLTSTLPASTSLQRGQRSRNYGWSTGGPLHRSSAQPKRGPPHRVPMCKSHRESTGPAKRACNGPCTLPNSSLCAVSCRSCRQWLSKNIWLLSNEQLLEARPIVWPVCSFPGSVGLTPQCRAACGCWI